MVQRSPTYLATLPSAENGLARLSRRVAPTLTHIGKRYYWYCLQMLSFTLARTFPKMVKVKLIDEVMKQLPPDANRDDFTPIYSPWDERIAAIADGDLLQCISQGSVSVVTDTIKSFTRTGLSLGSGKDIEADVVVLATGFNVKRNYPMSAVEVTVDGRPYDAPNAVLHKGMTLSGVPNFAFVMGYTNASWTMRAELVCDRFCKLLNFMDAGRYVQFCPRIDSSVEVVPSGFGELKSGYIDRSRDQLPKVGLKTPWRATRQNYFIDFLEMTRHPFKDGFMEFVAANSKTGHQTGLRSRL